MVRAVITGCMLTNVGRSIDAATLNQRDNDVPLGIVSVDRIGHRNGPAERSPRSSDLMPCHGATRRKETTNF